MNDAFPAVSTVSLKNAESGSLVKIMRSGGPKLALVADHSANGVRSFVWLNQNFQNGAPVIFAENWQVGESVLQYGSNIRFELGVTDDGLDPMGRNSWETAGAIVSINDDLFIRAAPDEQFRGAYKLVNIRNGSVYPNRPPDGLWTFLSWQLWVRDPIGDRHFMLTEFSAIAKRAVS